MPGSVRSSTYCAPPVTLSRPSLRGTETPTMGSFVMKIDYRTSDKGRRSQLASSRVSRECAIDKHRLSAQISGLHNPAQSFAKIRRHPIPIVQPLGSHFKVCFGVENNQVCVIARGNSALTRMT